MRSRFSDLLAKVIVELRDLCLADIDHSDSNLLEHLSGTANLLHAWGAEDYLCLAGFCHSLYGTRAFKRVSGIDRQQLTAIIGVEAELLVYLYSRIVTRDLYRDIEGRSELEFRFYDGGSATVKQNIALDLIRLEIANGVEQAARMPHLVEIVKRDFTFLGQTRALLGGTVQAAVDDLV